MNTDIPPVLKEITIYEAATYFKEFAVVDVDGAVVDISGWTGEALAVTAIGGVLQGTFEVHIVDGSAGTFSLYMSESQTANMSVGVYDVILTSDEATPGLYAVRHGPLDFVREASYSSVVEGVPLPDVESLNDLTDVVLVTPLSGQVLSYNGTTWVNSAASGLGDMLASTYDPATIAEQLVGLTATQTLTNKTLTAPVISGNLTTDGLIDGVDVATDVAANTAKVTYPSADSTKLAGIETAADVTDETNVAATASVIANTAKVTNANHTGEVTGSTALTVDKTVISGQTLVTAVGADHVLIGDASNADNLKRALVSDLTGGGIANIVEDATPQLGGNLDVNGFTVDGRDPSVDGTKLDAIEDNATIDQTNAEIRTAVEAATDSNVFTDNDHTKLNAIEALADVTDVANVGTAGAPIISAGAGAPSSTPTKVGDVYVDTTGDNVYAAAGTASSADWKQATGAGGGDLLAANNLSDVASAPTSRTNLGLAIGSDVQAHDAVLDATTASFLIADETKLDAIEALADVTDTTNVTAAGALMDSEVDADIKTLALPANTTITAAAATVLDDATTGAMLTTLGGATAAQGTTADSAMQDLVDDVTPQLGGALDVSGQSIVSVSAGDIPLTPDTTGNVIIDGVKHPQADGSANQLMKTDGAAQLAFADVNSLPVSRISGSTYSTIQHLQDIFHSVGLTSGGVITDDGDGTITVATGTGVIRATNSAVAEILFFDWAAESGVAVAVTDNAMNYVYAEYNSGSPQAVATISKRTDLMTNVLLGTVYREGTDLHITLSTAPGVGNHAAQMVQRMHETLPFARASGGVLSEIGTRNIAISAGSWWDGLTNFATSALDTSVAGTFRYFYSDGSGGFTEITAQTQINNTQYDDGSGSLATLSNNRYGAHWVYVSQNDAYLVVFGTVDGTLSVAEDAPEPSSLPPFFAETHARLIGKIIILKSASTFHSTQSAFDLTFSLQTASDHGGLVGLGDDDHSQYILVDGTRALTGDLATSGTFDGRDVAADGSKLDGIETSATADQTNAEIRTAVEAATDSNIFTDAENTKLGAIEASADVTDATNVAAAGAPIITAQAGAPSSTPATEGDINIDTTGDRVYIATGTVSSADWDLVPITGAQIKALYEAESNAFTDTKNTKLAGIETAADVTDETNVAATASVIANSAKVTNANHTGDVTGSTALTVDKTAISGQVLVTAVGTDHVLIGDASDTDNLKKALVSDLTGSGIANVVEDTSPQLGGHLDVNGQVIGDGTRELLTFVEDGSAVNHVEIENQATGSGPIVRATGDDANVDLHLDTKGTGNIKADDDLDVTGNVTVTGTVDARDIATDGSKLDGIETSATADQTDAEIRTAVEAATDSNVFTDNDHTKLNAVEALADVTDTTNVTSAGALMDSEVDVDIKTLVLPASTTITAAAATVLDDATVAAMVDTLGGASSGGTGGLARLVSPSFTTPALGTPSAAVLTNATGTAASLTVGATTGVEAGADVTDTTNVTAAGALMDSEVDADIKTLALPANTTISTFGATVIDDASAAAARVTLGTDITSASDVDDLTKIAAVNYTGTTDTLALTDAFALLYYSNASQVTVTIPTNASVAFAVGTRICLMSTGAGGITLTTTSLTLLGSSPNKTVVQNEAFYIEKVATDTWAIIGGTAA